MKNIMIKIVVKIRFCKDVIKKNEHLHYLEVDISTMINFLTD